MAQVVSEATSPLLHAALAMTRDANAAEELVQSTWIAAIGDASNYDARHPVVPWLLGIMNNRARRQRRSAARLPDPGRVPREAPSPDPSDAIAQRELMDKVQTAIATLPDVYRPVLDLYLHLGMTPQEISDALRRPRSTVRTQLARGLSKLRDLLRPRRDVG